MRTETGSESLPTLPNRPSLRWWCRGSAWRYQQWVRTVGVVKHCCYSRVINDSRTWCISSVFAALDTTNTGSFLQNWRLTDNSENQQFFAEFIISVNENITKCTIHMCDTITSWHCMNIHVYFSFYLWVRIQLIWFPFSSHSPRHHERSGEESLHEGKWVLHNYNKIYFFDVSSRLVHRQLCSLSPCLCSDSQF